MQRALSVCLVLACSCSTKSTAVGESEVVAFLKNSPSDVVARVFDEAGKVKQEAPPNQASAPPNQASAPPERTDLIGRGDKPLTLVGKTPEVGDIAPDFELAGDGLKTVGLAQFAGKVIVLSVVPSIDTRVCEAQTHHVNDASATLPPGTVVLTVSRDLPFAQTRFFEEAKMSTPLASDYHGGSFGRDWGLEIKETGLLARSVWVIDKSGTIVYRELVADQGTEPDYDKLWAAVKSLAPTP